MDEFEQIGIDDLFERIQSEESSIELAKDAYKNGCNISRYLEVLNPTDKNDEGSAFSRLMERAGIVAETDLKAGYVASNAGEAFFRNGNAGKFLFTEFFSREWRKVAFSNHRAVYLSSDSIVGSWERPYAESQTIRWDDLPVPPIPLSELVATTTTVDQNIVRSAYLDYDAAELRMYRVGETADIPLAKLTEREVTINLHKYGRGILASYEQMKRMRVDRLAFHVQGMAVQAEIDKVSTVLDVLVNGDGNSNTAAEVINQSTLDADATAGSLSLKAWLAFEMQWEDVARMTTALMQRAVALQLRLLSMPNANPPVVTIPLGAAVNNATLINSSINGIRYGYTSEAPSLKIVAFDRTRAIERFVEAGMNIAEMERFITNQTQLMVMTEIEGYGVIDINAAKILDVNA